MFQEVANCSSLYNSHSIKNTHNNITFRSLGDAKENQCKEIPKSNYHSPSIVCDRRNYRNPYSLLITDPKTNVKTNTTIPLYSNTATSLPRNFSSSSATNKWTLLDTEITKVKGDYFDLKHDV